MSEPVDPARPVNAERRRAARRHVDAPPPPRVEGERANFPAPVAVAPTHDEPAPQRREGPAIYAAQVMGQEGQKRGLRGGAPVLNQARSAYLATEYSGPRDRRPASGRVTKTEI